MAWSMAPLVMTAFAWSVVLNAFSFTSPESAANRR